MCTTYTQRHTCMLHMQYTYAPQKYIIHVDHIHHTCIYISHTHTYNSHTHIPFKTLFLFFFIVLVCVCMHVYAHICAGVCVYACTCVCMWMLEVTLMLFLGYSVCLMFLRRSLSVVWNSLSRLVCLSSELCLLISGITKPGTSPSCLNLNHSF